MRAGQRSQIDAVQLLAGRDVDDGDAVAPSRARTGVVAREGKLPVVGHGQLMRVLPGGHATHHLAIRRIDNRHRVFALVQH